MNKRYNSSYGGVSTEIGCFLPHELADYFMHSHHENWARALRGVLAVWDGHTCEKIMDIAAGDDRELLVYGTTTGYLRLVVENHNQRLAYA